MLGRRLRKRSFDATSYQKKSYNQRLRDLLCFVIRFGFGKITHFPAGWGILLGVIVLYNILIIKYISCFDLNVLSVNLRNRFERILIDVVQMLSKF